MSALPVLMILFGSVMKLMKTQAVLDGFARVGAPERLIIPVGLTPVRHRLSDSANHGSGSNPDDGLARRGDDHGTSDR